MDSMQKILDNENVIDRKNQMLQPLFRDIKSQIRHMTHTPEFEIMREYVHQRSLVLKSPKGKTQPEYADEKIETLRKLYGALLAKRK